MDSNNKMFVQGLWVGIVIGFGLGARRMEKTINNYLRKPQELSNLHVDLLNYMLDGLSDEDMSEEEFSRTVNEKIAFIRVIERM